MVDAGNCLHRKSVIWIGSIWSLISCDDGVKSSTGMSLYSMLKTGNNNRWYQWSNLLLSLWLLMNSARKRWFPWQGWLWYKFTYRKAESHGLKDIVTLHSVWTFSSDERTCFHMWCVTKSFIRYEMMWGVSPIETCCERMKVLSLKNWIALPRMTLWNIRGFLCLSDSVWCFLPVLLNIEITFPR